MEDNDPKGIEFFNVKSGETHFAKLEPTIQAYINSSDMGINASRGQDFGWKLAPAWMKKVKEFRRDEVRMQQLATKLQLSDEESPSVIQILFAIYGQQIRAARAIAQDNDNAYEEAYLQAVSEGKTEVDVESVANAADVDDEDDGFDAFEEQLETPVGDPADPKVTVPKSKPKNK